MLNDDIDALKWSYNMELGVISEKLAYQQLTDNFQVEKFWWHNIWKWKVTSRILLLCWLAFENRILTWDNLLKRGFSGPNICPLCGLEEETIFIYLSLAVLLNQFGRMLVIF